jgi:hypothetical protein
VLGKSKSLGAEEKISIHQTIQSIQQAIDENNSGHKIKDVVVGMLDNTFAVFNILIIYSSQPQEDRRR